MKPAIKHILGPFLDNKQYCLLCGECIVDYTNVMFPSTEPPPRGWPEGTLYVFGKNPTIFRAVPPEGREIVSCTPPPLKD